MVGRSSKYPFCKGPRPIRCNLYCGYGYRYGEQKLPPIGPVKEGTKFKDRPIIQNDSRRALQQFSLGCHWHEVALPHADTYDDLSVRAGVAKRFAFRPPTPKAGLIEEMVSFTKQFLQTHLTPLEPYADTSVETWLKKTSYPLWRRQELHRLWLCVGDIGEEPRYFNCKSFGKDETYPEFKHVRGINSRSDQFKCAVGPIFKLIEEQVYKLPEFIKHVPVADRPAYIMKRLYKEGAFYLQTDYTAFESLFTKLLMKIEFELYKYMTRNLVGGPEWYRLVKRVLSGKNKCYFKNFIVTVLATRMSGEMCTSLGNGFGNLMFMLFAASKAGCSDVEGVVEGDDGLFTMRGTPPSESDFSDLGLVIKIVRHEEIATASFCGLVFDPVDQINVRDPLEVLASFAWAPSRYALCRRATKLGLLRCKALSLAHQYPGMPIVSALAQYGLRITRGLTSAAVRVAKRFRDDWRRSQFLKAIESEKSIPVVDPPNRTRLLVERLYHISVEKQIEIESYLNRLNEMMPLKFDLEVPEAWKEYYEKYVIHYDFLPADLNWPSGLVPWRSSCFVPEWVKGTPSRSAGTVT